MYNTNRQSNLQTYHYQTSKDWYAVHTTTPSSIVEARLRDIKEAYDEFMRDLLTEAQEAY